MKRILYTFIITFLSCSWLFIPVVNAADVLSFPAADLVAPEIKHSPITTKVIPGEITTIYATVTDNVAVKNATVFYRDIGSADFKRINMTRKSGTDEFSSELVDVKAPGVEYYIQASDIAGNTILHGHTFSPFAIAVSSDIPPQKQTASTASIAVPEEKMIVKPAAAASKGINKWVWVGLGVLAVGALAGGGGGDSAADTTGPGTVVITGNTPTQ